MTSRRKIMYRELFRYMKDHLHINAASFMSDFEKAERSAAREVWIGILVLGCNFHFVRAIYQKAFQLMGSAVKGRNSDPNTKFVVKLFQRLSLLPKENIEEGLSEIRNFIRNNRLTQNFREFYR